VGVVGFSKVPWKGPAERVTPPFGIRMSFFFLFPFSSSFPFGGEEEGLAKRRGELV